MYRSAKGSVEEIIEVIKNMENPKKANIVTGDMNICARKQRNSQLIKSLIDEEYKLLTTTTTHVKGGHINHTYTKNAMAQLHLYTPITRTTMHSVLLWNRPGCQQNGSTLNNINGSSSKVH